MVLMRIGVASSAKVLGILYAVLGLIFGILTSCFFLIGEAIGGMSGGPGRGPMALTFGVGAVIILPLLYGALGFIFGALGAAIYNMVARLVGGIELEFDSRAGAAASSPAGGTL